MNILNSNDYWILTCIRDTKNNIGLCQSKGMMKNEIQGRSELSLSTVSRSIKKLLKAGFINEGIKQVNTKTYYINSIGKAKLLEICEGECINE